MGILHAHVHVLDDLSNDTMIHDNYGHRLWASIKICVLLYYYYYYYIIIIIIIILLLMNNQLPTYFFPNETGFTYNMYTL